MATQNICFFNKYGFCKYLENCRNYHENKKCEKSNCEIRECQLKHPKICEFFVIMDSVIFQSGVDFPMKL